MLQYLRNGVVCSCDAGSGGGGGAAAADVAAEDPGGAGGGGGSDGGGGTAAALKLGGGGPPAQKGGGGGSGPGMFTFEEFMNDKNEGSERVRELSQEVDVDVGDEEGGGDIINKRSYTEPLAPKMSVKSASRTLLAYPNISI